MIQPGVSYIADRGYMSFRLCHQVLQAHAHFIFRVKSNLLYHVIDTFVPELPDNAEAELGEVTDQLIGYDNDEFRHTYRLISFTIGSESFRILTDRRDLTTFQLIVLYAYRWQVELLFRFLKRTMNGIHLIKQEAHGVTIQFYAILTLALFSKRKVKTFAFQANRFISNATHVVKSFPFAGARRWNIVMAAIRSIT